MLLRLARSTRNISIAGLPSKLGNSTKFLASERTLDREREGGDGDAYKIP